MKKETRDIIVDLQARLLRAGKERIAEQERVIEALQAYLKHATRSACAECDGGDVPVVYAVYEVKPRRGDGVFIAICLDNPFLYTVADTRSEAADALREKVRDFHGDEDETAENRQTLEGIEIPNSLPEDF